MKRIVLLTRILEMYQIEDVEYFMKYTENNDSKKLSPRERTDF